MQNQDTAGPLSRWRIIMGLFSDADFWWVCESGGGVLSALHLAFCSLQQGLPSPASRAFIPPHLCNQRTKPVVWRLSRSISAFPSLQHLVAGILHKQRLDKATRTTKTCGLFHLLLLWLLLVKLLLASSTESILKPLETAPASNRKAAAKL